MVTISETTFSDTFLLSENVWTLLQISLKFVPKVRNNNIPGIGWYIWTNDG